MRLDPRGAPDLSHYDYAAENVRMFEQGKREGAADKALGKEPNHYLYVFASPTYSHAKGYRIGYGDSGDLGRANVATYDDWFPDIEKADERPIVAQQQCGAWTKKRKGTAMVHTHPDAYEGRAVVENHWGVHFNGRKYTSLYDAKVAALCPPPADWDSKIYG